MAEKLVNFRMDDELYQDLKMLALKERVAVKDLITSMVGEYVKVHKDGNPQYTMDQFEDPDFIACPAFYRKQSIWEHYMDNATPVELENIKRQIIVMDKTLLKFI